MALPVNPDMGAGKSLLSGPMKKFWSGWSSGRPDLSF